MASSLEVGDRVRLRTSSVVPAGTLGYRGCINKTFHLGTLKN